MIVPAADFNVLPPEVKALAYYYPDVYVLQPGFVFDSRYIEEHKALHDIVERRKAAAPKPYRFTIEPWTEKDQARAREMNGEIPSGK